MKYFDGQLIQYIEPIDHEAISISWPKSLIGKYFYLKYDEGNKDINPGWWVVQDKNTKIDLNEKILRIKKSDGTDTWWTKYFKIIPGTELEYETV